MAPTRILLLGQPVVVVPHGTVRLSSARASGLLWFLAAQPDRRFSRSYLAALLWDDCAEANGRNRLRTTLSRLHRELPVWPLLRAGSDLAWAAGATVTVDASEFRALCQAARSGGAADTDILVSALSLWRGPFLDRFDLPGASLYDEWLAEERGRWEQAILNVLTAVLQRKEAAGAWTEVIEHARRGLAISPFQERFHRSLMVAYYQNGDRALALSQYAQCCSLLKTELDVDPDPATTALRDRISAGTLPRRPSRSAAPVDLVPPLPGPPRHETDDPPLVGRTVELQRVRDHLSRAPGTPGRLLLLQGEAGIGKSRLAREAVRAPERFGAAASGTLLWGHCYEEAAGLPFAPFVEAITHLLPRLDVNGLNLAAPWLAAMGQLVPDLTALRPDLHLPPHLDPDEQKRRQFEGVARFLGALPGPATLVLEDLHWADEATLHLLAYLVRHAAMGDLALLATARSIDTSTPFNHLLRQLEREGRLSRLELEGLSLTAVASLVAAVTGRPKPALAERLHTETRGNPLFAVECLRHLLASGCLDPQAQELADGLPMPGTVQTVIRSHLDRLAPQARELLATAAIFPRTVAFGVLQQTSGLAEDAALAALDEMLQAAILVEQPAGAWGAPGVAFRHDLIRRVVRDDLSQARLQTLHRRALAALHDGEGPSPTWPLTEQLAHHAASGGLWEQGLHWSQQAAESALRVFAYASAVPLLEQALACAEQLPATPDTRRRAIDIRLQLGTVAFYSHPHRLVDWLDPAIGAAAELGDEVRLTRGRISLAGVRIYQGAPQAAKRLAEEALTTARTLGAPSLLAPCLRVLGHALVLCGELARAREVLHEATPLQERLGLHLDTITVQTTLAGILATQGQLSAAEQMLRDLERQSRQSKDAAALAHVLTYQAATAFLRGDWDLVIAASAEGVELARAAGHPFHEYQAALFRGLALTRTGGPETGLAEQQRVIGLARQLGTGFFLGLAHAVLGLAHLAAGEPEAAVAAARSGWTIARSGGATYEVGICMGVLGHALAGCGETAEARNMVRQALKTLHRLGMLPWAALCHAFLATLEEREEHRLAHRRKARALFRRLGMHWDLQQLG